MLKKLKNRVDVYFERKIKKLFNKQQKVNQIQFNHAQLNQLFVDTSFYFPFTTWSMSPSTIIHVLNDIVLNDRKNIIEFGSGASTFYIAKLLKTNSIQASFFSVESNFEWANKINKQLDTLGLAKYVTVIYAPIQSIERSLALGEQEVWYDTTVLNEHLKMMNEVDLVLIDGPFGGLTPNARFSPIPYIKDRLAKSYSIFLDDVDREDEKHITQEWIDMLNCSVKKIERYVVLSSNTKFFSKPLQL
ncbi:class I SAM-dependent methyltransferase [Psychroserpens sp. Hel_I_66]|uniref:class I SAM-dependent methyltransferase n=1 Tax=Psychroserpens sp. Hel_I_66 TaxID=1250004 RepID=UPI000647BA07|nr:class I SAM-dependent methyltransferase [Psychroserpens sp. Hel_I_66]